MKKIIASDGYSYLYNSDYINEPALASIKSIIEQTHSQHDLERGKVHFFSIDGIALVQKHYFRGGHIAKINRDKYLWSGLESTRVYKEWALLETMTILQLPVPVPILSIIKQSGLFYSADLITRQIENIQPLASLLLKQNISVDLWKSIGRLIWRFHKQGIYHADLNATNILISDKEEIFLIDFDKAKRMMQADRWMNKVISRLHRSLNKLKQTHSAFHFTEQDWQALLDGYQKR